MDYTYVRRLCKKVGKDTPKVKSKFAAQIE